MGVGVPDKKMKVVGWRIEIYWKRVGLRGGGRRKIIAPKKVGDGKMYRNTLRIFEDVSYAGQSKMSREVTEPQPGKCFD